MGRVVGIDLGTTYSLIARLDPATGTPQCIPGPYGSRLCPSVVSVDENGKILVGEPARHAPAPPFRPYDLLREKIDGPRRRRRAGRAEDISLSHRCRQPKRNPRSAGGSHLHPAGDFCFHPARAEGLGRSVFPRSGRPRGGHRSGVFQRRAAPSHQGCRTLGRLGSPAAGERADRCGASLWPAQTEARARRRL